MVKSLTAREIFRRCPQVKKQLWGGEFWTDGFFASTIGKHGDEEMIGKYVKNQGNEYHKLHSNHQLALFWDSPRLAAGLFIFRHCLVRGCVDGWGHVDVGKGKRRGHPLAGLHQMGDPHCITDLH